MVLTSRTHVDTNGHDPLTPQRVVMLTSPHIGWAGVRGALAASRFIDLIAETRAPERALTILTEEQPDGLVMPSRIEGAPVVPFVQEVSRRCPPCRVLLIGREFSAEETDSYRELPVYGYFIWSELAASTVQLGVLTALSDRAVVLSEQVWQVVAPARALKPAEEERSCVLTPRQHAVLRQLDAGLSEKAIAGILGESGRTVRRDVNDLARRFGVKSRVGLGKEAHRLGLL
jgi:DNA-binding NarL/FixJ family response regulator